MLQSSDKEIEMKNIENKEIIKNDEESSNPHNPEENQNFPDQEKADLNPKKFHTLEKASKTQNPNSESFCPISSDKLAQWNQEGKWVPYEDIEYESAFFSFLPNCFFKIRTLTSRPFTYHPFKCCQVSLGEIILTTLEISIVVAVATILALQDIKDGDEATGEFASILLALSFASAGKNLVFHLFMGMPWERQVSFHKFLAFMGISVSAAHGFIMGLGHDESLTGVVLASAMGGIIVTSFFYLRRYCYSLFYILHWLIIIVIIVFALLHEASVVMFGVGAWVLDLLIRFFLVMRFKFRTAKTELFVLPGSLVRVEITPKPGKRFRFKSGQYVFICIPRANIWEFHPISISNTGFDRKIVLHFKKVGRWTKKVHALIEKQGQKIEHQQNADFKSSKIMDQIESGTRLETTVFINGPYGNPRVDIDSPRYKLVVLIAGGIGVTPMQSIYNELLIQHVRGRPFVKVKLIWSLRDEGMLHSVAGHSDCFYDKQDIHQGQISSMDKCNLVNLEYSKVMEANFFLTKGSSEEDKHRLMRRYKARVHLGRPNFPKIMEEMGALAVQNDLHHVAVLSCGPGGMIDHAFKTSYEKTKKYTTSEGKPFKVNFDFHSEVFEF